MPSLCGWRTCEMIDAQMAIPRRVQINFARPGWVHCVARCVRRAYLAGDGFSHRRAWIEDRLRFLREVFACEVAAFAVMSNHVHVVVRMDPQLATGWNDHVVAERWLRLFPGHWEGDFARSAKDVAIDQSRLAVAETDRSWVAERRERLGSLSWFMRCLCEVIARRANAEDDCTGRFWEGRYNSTPLLDKPALLACMAYVDLNPIRALVATSLERSDHTSGQIRMRELREVTDDAYQGCHGENQCHQQGEDHALAARHHGARSGMDAVVKAVRPGRAVRDLVAQGIRTPERSWLTPISVLTDDGGGASSTWSAAAYLALVEATGRFLRNDKRGALSQQLPHLISRLDPDWSQDAWITTMCGHQQMSHGSVGGRDRLQAEAQRRGHGRARTKCVLFQALTTKRRAQA